MARKTSHCSLFPFPQGSLQILQNGGLPLLPRRAICRSTAKSTPHAPATPAQAYHTLSPDPSPQSEVHASLMINFELINSSTCALSILSLPFSPSFNSTAKTSIGGSNPSLLARTHRFIRAIPMQGCRSGQTSSNFQRSEENGTGMGGKQTPNCELMSNNLKIFSSRLTSP